MAGLLAAVITFAAVAKYTKKETVVGVVVPAEGISRLSSIRAGVIRKILVSSGEHVKAGQPIFEISYDPVLLDGNQLSVLTERTTQSELLAVENQAAAKRGQLLQSQGENRARIAGIEADIGHLELQKQLQVERIDILEKDYEAASTLLEKQFISQANLMKKRDLLLDARQRDLDIDKALSQAKSQIAELSAEIAGQGEAINEADANLRLSKAQYDEKRLESQSSVGATIVAPKSGILTNVVGKVGDVVQAEKTIALVVQDGNKVSENIELWVPSKSIGFVQAGNKVRLMYDAFPFQTFGVGTGKVIEISTAPLMPSEIPIPIETKEQMYKVVVSMDSDRLAAYGREWVVMPGLRLHADLVLDEKNLLGWLLDPLTAARNRMAA